MGYSQPPLNMTKTYVGDEDLPASRGVVAGRAAECCRVHVAAAAAAALETTAVGCGSDETGLGFAILSGC
jgi:hypothetical protein